MIGRLRGVLVGRSTTAVVVDVQGTGYEIQVTPRTQGSLPGIGEEIVLHTHLHVRDDALILYGFGSESERDLFRVLITASGVGPRLGQSILASLTVSEVRRAIAAEDVDALTIVPGVGKRSAQKIVLELKPKLEEAEADVIDPGGSTASVRQALEGLGYTAPEIREVLGSIDSGASIAEQIRSALQALSRR
ncbi:MAG TPA: Holliday junction branch migration protein RuvA [Acidimicrobiia bacterium]|jgi:Holliday junction DNA helicase RuvA